MAGRGPAPKAASERRNFTKPKRGEWVDLEPLSKPVLPPSLPRRSKKEGPWSSRTKRLWSGWRTDRVTQTFEQNEIDLLIETAYLQEEVSRGNTRMAAEVRQRLDGLALTMKGKRDLRFRMAEALPADEKKARKARPAKRRAHLTAVK